MADRAGPTEFTLSVTPLKPTNIPPEDAVLTAARKVLESTQSWKQGKIFHNVTTLHRPKQSTDGATWHCRVSIHDPKEASFDDMWSKLGVDKATNEMQFIPDIKKVTLVKQMSPTQSIWTMYYKFPPPVSPRVFTVLQVVHLDSSSPRTGIIVSIPIDLSSPEDKDLARLEQKGVKGRYASVECIRELEDGKVEWRMATSSTPSGRIPSFFVERSIAGKIAQDVPHFFKWLHSATKA